jgi:colicin import membrane protein
MPGNAPTPSISLRKRAMDAPGGQERLPKWLGLSLLLHGIFIIGLFLMPYWPTRTIVPPPVYTVDLVGGERIGANNLATDLLPKPVPKPVSRPVTPAPPPPPPPRKEKKEVKAEPPPPPPAIKEEPKTELIEKPAKKPQETAQEKARPKEKVAAKSKEKVAAKKVVKKKAAKEETAGTITKKAPTQTKTDEASLERVRERLIQSAVAQVKNRTQAQQKASQEDALSAGTGEGLGSASLGTGKPGGGGVVKGIDFIAYQNRMLSTIKANWAWVGQNNNLKVVVQFQIRDDGDISKLEIVQPSGDPSYDESVLRAVTKSSPLPPPPENYRKDFSEIRITFRPKDLGA